MPAFFNNQKVKPMSKLNTHVYDVDVKPIKKLNIEEERPREYASDGKITVGSRLRIMDTVDTHEIPESMPDGKIKPYGLDADASYDVEVKEQVADSVIQEHIDRGVQNDVSD